MRLVASYVPIVGQMKYFRYIQYVCWEILA